VLSFIFISILIIVSLKKFAMIEYELEQIFFKIFPLKQNYKSGSKSKNTK